MTAGGSGDADILIRYGIFNTLAGDPVKGIAALDKAVTLDRFKPARAEIIGADAV